MRVEDVIIISVANQSSEIPAVDYPHKDIEDLRFYCQMLTKDGRFIITNAIMNSMGMTEEELWERAEANMHTSYKFVPLPSMLPPEWLPMDAEDMKTPLYVLTNQEGTFGSGFIYSQTIMSEIANQLCRPLEELFIIPSSVHEVIILNSDEVSVDEINRVICEVNATELAEEDILSDSVYVWDGILKKIS